MSLSASLPASSSNGLPFCIVVGWFIVASRALGENMDATVYARCSKIGHGNKI